MSEDYDMYDQDHDSHSDNGENDDFPEIVALELDRRAEDPSLPPASAQVQQALREWFENGGSPVKSGGYIDLMEELGVTPKSTELPVWDPACNVLYNKNVETEKEATQRHEARVRLLRYREFLESSIETKQKVTIPSDFHFDESAQGPVEDPNNDAVVVETSSLENEFDLTEAQIMSMVNGFVTEFYHYVNHELLYHGATPNARLQDATEGIPEGYRTYEIDCSQQEIEKQIRELTDRYDQQRSPLGPRARLNQDHAPQMKRLVGILFSTLEQIACPTAVTGTLFGNIFNMLTNASYADVDAAKGIVYHKKILLRLRSKTIKYCAKAEDDLTRDAWASTNWLKAYIDLDHLFTCVIRKLTRKDEDASSHYAMFQSKEEQKKKSPNALLAELFFEKHVEPALVSSMRTSKRAWERSVALFEFGKIVKELSPTVAKRISTDEKMWRILQEACTVKEPVEAELNPRQLNREKLYAPFVAKRAVGVFVSLCQKGMTLDEQAYGTCVAPGRVATKLVSRGVVPLLMDIASQSPHNMVATEAVEGLAHISRTKDCRTLMLQHPKGPSFVKELLTSSEGGKAGNAMLLIVHLFWDTEWHDTLFAYENPSIEVTAAKWATYSIKWLCDKAQELRFQEEESRQECVDDFVNAFTRQGDEGAAARREVELEEIERKWRNKPKWFEVESSAYMASQTLRRAIILLSGVNHSGEPERLLRVNALHMAACCIDHPDSDMYGAVGALFQNFMACARRTITADMFPDPRHVLRSIIYRVDSFAQAQKFDGQQNMVLMTTLMRICSDPSWQSVCAQVAEQDSTCQFHIEMMRSRFGGVRSESERSQPSATTRRKPPPAMFGHGISTSCSQLTGKLRKCDGCGKMEGKKGDFFRCSKCRVAVYCGRDCQRKAWKKHKKVCADLANKEQS